MSSSAALTGYLDVAQVVLYMFWAFFAGLIYYLHRENKREGYPLESDRSGQITVQGFPAVPKPKTYLLADGSTVQAPNFKRETRELKMQPIAGFPGAPFEPTGDPMVDGVGPASWTERHDEPDRMPDGRVRIRPLRDLPGYSIAPQDPDPRGMPVLACDGVQAGTVADIWVDRGEMIIRYLEVTIAGGRTVMLPMTLARVWAGRKVVEVASVEARHFAMVPQLRDPTVITFLEEERVGAFFAGGHLYATPSRLGPWV